MAGNVHVETLEDSVTWAAVYLVSNGAAAATSVDGPPMAGTNTPLTGSLSDTPHAPSAANSQDPGSRFFVFRNLAINDSGSYRLKVCLFQMAPTDSPGSLGSARHIQSVVTREIMVTGSTSERSVRE